MKEFIEKLIGRLEESQERYDDVSFAQLNEFGHTLDYEYAKGKRDGVEESIEIVNQLAEEYNNGWISVEDALPELTEGTECFKQSPCCLVTLKSWDGDMTESVGWYNQSGVWNEDSKNCKVVAWMPLPPKYQPKGE